MILRVIIAEDSMLVREGIQLVLDRQPDIEVVAACPDLPGLLEAVDQNDPDVVLTDVRMPPTSTGRAYLLKERISEPDQLAAAVRTVAQGGSVIDPAVVEVLVSASRRAPASPIDSLTARELQVLDQIAQGKSNAAVAGSLYLSERAVEKHINALFAKLGLGPEPDINRRVKAVLMHLSARGAG
jgi:DNA-binding NarL/FixJ family response regulator